MAWPCCSTGYPQQLSPVREEKHQYRKKVVPTLLRERREVQSQNSMEGFNKRNQKSLSKRLNIDFRLLSPDQAWHET